MTKTILLVVAHLFLAADAFAQKSTFILFTKTLQSRGQLQVKGSFETRDVLVSVNSQPAVASSWELAVSKVSISNQSGKLCEAELSAFPNADMQPFKDLNALAAQDTPQHTCFVYTVGSIPNAIIFDHTTTPPAIRRVEFPKDLEVSPRYAPTAVINYSAVSPSEVQIVFTTTLGTIRKRISLLTGSLLGE